MPPGNRVHHRRSSSSNGNAAGNCRNSGKEGEEENSDKDEECEVLLADGKINYKPVQPTNDQLVKELMKKSCMNLTLPEKFVKYIHPFIESRQAMVDEAKQQGEEHVIAIKEAIPEKLRVKQKAGAAVAQFMLNIHTAVKAYIDSVQKNGTGYVLRIFLSSFEELDEAINTAISNIQSVDHKKRKDMTRFNEHGGIGSLSFPLTELLTLPPGFATVVCGLGFVATAGAGGLLGKAWIIC
jgi:hypothetical protein